MDFDIVTKFEKEIAKFYGAPYAVATDCCTHAIELCLRVKKPNLADIPYHTYISIPFTFQKLGLDFIWNSVKWTDYYYVTNEIIDAAVYWKPNGYIPNSMMCLSFQFKKHLSLGRGGAILLDNLDDYNKLKKMSYDGRMPNISWQQQDIAEIGYHYYMTPETAQLGLEKLKDAKLAAPKTWSWQDYPDLRNMSVFKYK